MLKPHQLNQLSGNFDPQAIVEAAKLSASKIITNEFFDDDVPTNFCTPVQLSLSSF